MLFQAFYSVCSERQLMEQLAYNLLFRWFVGLSVDEPVRDPTAFTKNRQRMLDGHTEAAFMDALPNQNEVKVLLLAEHFSVDGTPIQAWAPRNKIDRKDGNDELPGPGRNEIHDLCKEKCSNETDASTINLEAR
jgi:transposase